MNPWYAIQDFLEQLDAGSSAPVASGSLFTFADIARW